MIDAVVFDLDGVLVDSERAWSQARERVVREHGGTWPPGATKAMLGMSSTEWARYLRDELGVTLDPADIITDVVEQMKRLYRERLPLIPGAQEAVRALAAGWPLGLASSSNRPIIDLALELSDLRDCFAVTVSSEEVAHGKPAPDVYLAAVAALAVPAARAAAIEDSANGLRSAAAGGLHVVAIPNREFPPGPDALALADRVLASLRELRPEVIYTLV